MWIIIKYKTNSLNLLKSEINKKLRNSKFYLPKIKLLKNILGARKVTFKRVQNIRRLHFVLSL